jgi:hypothetical protein
MRTSKLWWVKLGCVVGLLGGCGGPLEEAELGEARQEVTTLACTTSTYTASTCTTASNLYRRAFMTCEETRRRLDSYTLGGACGGGLYRSVTYTCCY